MAAGVGAVKAKVTRKPSLSRIASTEAAGASDFFGASTAAAGAFFDAAGFAVSIAAAGFASEGAAAFCISTGIIISAAGVFSAADAFSAAGAI